MAKKSTTSRTSAPKKAPEEAPTAPETASEASEAPEATPEATEPEEPAAPQRGERVGAEYLSTQEQPRHAYAMKVLVSEVTGLFPEITYEFGVPRAWGAITTVIFEVDHVEGAADLLRLVSNDERVESATYDHREGLFEIALRPSLRTMDSREPFGLPEAWSVMVEE